MHRGESPKRLAELGRRRVSRSAQLHRSGVGSRRTTDEDEPGVETVEELLGQGEAHVAQPAGDQHDRFRAADRAARLTRRAVGFEGLDQSPAVPQDDRGSARP